MLCTVDGCLLHCAWPLSSWIISERFKQCGASLDVHITSRAMRTGLCLDHVIDARLLKGAAVDFGALADKGGWSICQGPSGSMARSYHVPALFWGSMAHMVCLGIHDQMPVERPLPDLSAHDWWSLACCSQECIAVQNNSRFNSEKSLRCQHQDITAGRMGAVNEHPRSQVSQATYLHCEVVQRFLAQGGRALQLDLARATAVMRLKVEEAWHGARTEGQVVAPTGLAACVSAKLAWFWHVGTGDRHAPRWQYWGRSSHPPRASGIGAKELRQYCEALQRYVTAAAQWRGIYEQVLLKSGLDWSAVCFRPADDCEEDGVGGRFKYLHGERGAGGEDLQHLAQQLSKAGRPKDVLPRRRDMSNRYHHGGNDVYVQVCPKMCPRTPACREIAWRGQSLPLDHVYAGHTSGRQVVPERAKSFSALGDRPPGRRQRAWL